jgi:hypothetical protein
MEPQRERLEGAPRGRTAGGPGPDAFKCSRCNETQRVMSEITTESVCPKCGADMHTCSNCKNFDTSSRWECRETIPARVAPKDQRNECALFAPKIVRDLAADKGVRIEAPDDARKAFEALFKK